MAASCHKCRQATPHQGDSWCVACCAHEALAKELAENWGSVGSRAIASDILVSGLRQIRAVRRLGLAGAGGNRALAAQAGVSRTPAEASIRPPEPLLPPSGAAVKAEVPSEEESEDQEESSEEEAPAPAAAAKSLARERSPILRSRGSGDRRERGGEGAPAVEPKEKRPREDERRSEKRDRRSEKEERHRERDHKDHRKDSEREYKKKKRSKRGGAKHQRLYRANLDPYKRFHHRRAEGYWDEHHTSFGP